VTRVELLERCLRELGCDRERPPTRDELARWLAQHDSPWRLAAPGGAYEAEVCAGSIPTRDRSWHDAFNVLVFARWPLAKAALHRRMLAMRGLRATPGVRTRPEDALTLVDETAIVFAGSVHAMAALAHARGTRHTSDDAELAAIDRIVHTQHVAVHVFGHALLEHAVLRRPTIRAGVVTLVIDDAHDRVPTRAQIDRVLARAIAAGEFREPRMSPALPWPDARVDRWSCVTSA
jgi:hypothetical protein